MKAESLVVACILSAIVIGDDRCPPDYIYCATEGWLAPTFCHIPSSYKSGFMSFGADGRFLLLPYSVEDYAKGDQKIQCDSHIEYQWYDDGGRQGDISPGKTKHCCYHKNKNYDIGLDREGYEGTDTPENLGRQRYFQGLVTTRFGNDGKIYLSSNI